MNHSSLVALDLELCCWGNTRSTGDILQIGLAEIDLGTERITQHGYYVNPISDSISDYCVNLTGITPRKIERCGRPLHKVIDSIYSKIGHRRIYVTWGGDLFRMASIFCQYNVPFKFKHCIDLSVLYHIHFNVTEERHGLERAMQEYGLTFEGNRHDAVVDATNTARLAVKILSRPVLSTSSK